MVGHISGVSRAPENPKRWIINIDSYAEIDIPEQWDGNRNPVSYRTLEEYGIVVTELDFKPVSKVNVSALGKAKANDEYEDEDDENAVIPLTLKDAKAGLALYFGVSEDDIQITIRG